MAIHIPWWHINIRAQNYFSLFQSHKGDKPDVWYYTAESELLYYTAESEVLYFTAESEVLYYTAESEVFLSRNIVTKWQEQR